MQHATGRTLRQIHEVFGLSAQTKDRLSHVTQIFPFQATEYYLSLIDWDDPADPIRRIIVPDEAELSGLTMEDLDPCAEAANFVAPGVQHKYPHTALVLAGTHCAGLCRYCFRKRLFIDSQTARPPELAFELDPALSYIATHPQINNVLLTGGDPLMLPTARLLGLVEALREMDHIQVVRIGSRVPVFNPQRILGDPALVAGLARLSTASRRVYLVTHFDHPREVTALAIGALAEFINRGIPVLNQHPILAGVNDDSTVLIELYRALTNAGVQNYYAFIVRPTAGNRAFQVPLTRACELLEQANRAFSGLDKRFRLVLSHATGKIHILGMDRELLYLKYHRARDPRDENRMLLYHRNEAACWLDELEPAGLQTA